MNNNRAFLIGELLTLFILIPGMLILKIPSSVKAGAVLTGIIYVLVLVIKNRLVARGSLFSLPGKSYWKYILLRFLVLVLFTTALLYLTDRENLFIVVRKNPTMWIMISIFYSVISVFPQEFLYRTFFFNRYGFLFKKTYMLIMVNALVFCFAHIGFKNILVLSITLIGGFVFAITYFRTRSLLITSMEHALYGSWLFTVGLGEMLAFPTPE